MKPTYILPLLAFAIPSALSQPLNTESDSTSVATLTSREDTIPYACTRTSTVVESQLAEISHLQSKSLPIPADLAGYFYSVTQIREMLGCPATSLLGTHSKRAAAFADPCKALHVEYESVINPMRVFVKNNIPIPPYLAGYWSSVQDGNKALGCGFPTSPGLKNSTTSIQASE